MPTRVRTDVPFGNACDVSVTTSKGLAEVAFAADPHGGPEALWFCFRVETGARPPEQLRLTLKHSENMLGCGKPAGLRPVVRARDGDWERLGAPEVTELPDGRRLVAWTLDMPKGFVDVAFCYPYGREEVDALVRETGGFYAADVIGVSQGGRPIVRLSNDPGAPGGTRPGLYLIARQHSGETSGSWVLDGLLRHLATLGADAPLVWSVPLANIDGVEQGDYGKDNFPYDLNRAWDRRRPMRHETLVLQRDIARWKTRCRPMLGLDFHAPGGTEDDGVLMFVPDPLLFPGLHEETRTWTVPIAEALRDDYARKPFERVVRYPSRWETPTFARFFCESVGVLGLTLETPYAQVRERVLTREDYREIGARFADACAGRLTQR